MEEEREEGGLTFGEILRVIFSQKWLVLIITALITVAGTLGVYFGMNNSRREYSASFVLNLPGSNAASVNYVYPDGTTFYYSDMVSIETLRSVKASDEAFTGIDVDAMANNGKITITRTRTQTSSNIDNYEISYKISAKANCFKDKITARKFIVALANTPGLYLIEMEIDYDSYIVAAEGANNYENEINYLKEQLDYIVKLYNQLIEEYKPDFVITEGKTLQNNMQDVKAYIETKTLDNLNTQAKENGYLKSADLIPQYSIQLIQADKDLKDAEFALENMKAGTSDASQNAEAIRQQANRVSELRRKVETLKKYVESSVADVPQHYKDELEAAKKTVTDFTAKFKLAATTVYGTSSMVSFATSNIISTEGEMSLLISLALSFIAGLIIAMIAGFITGRIVLKKRAAKAAAVGPQIVTEEYSESQAQAAVTDAEEKKKK